MIIVLLLSLLSIFATPTFLKKGVLITGVDVNSTAFEQGFRQGQIITSVDGQSIETLDELGTILQSKYLSGTSVKTIFTTTESEIIYFSSEVPKITISEIKNTNLQLGLDLAGGSRGLVKAQDRQLTQSEARDLSEIISNRLNVYGIEDIKVAPVSDLSGEYYVKIEIAGATQGDLERLISGQGKFEAKIGDEVVFVGGEEDITSVTRSGQDVQIECFNSEGAYACNFRFVIYLSEDAAKRHAEITSQLGVNSTDQGNYLDKKLDLFLDDRLVDSLLIGESLKGSVTTQIQIQGSAAGDTVDNAYDAAEAQMNELQTILITGSLPFKLEIVKLDTISPTLGKDFTKSIFLAGLVALVAVALVIFIRYRKWKSSTALLIVNIFEIIIVLGIASTINWSLDLPSIAGILASIGTGVDSEIIILDGANEGKILNLKQRLKRAFSIILGAYFTSVAALFPLLWAAAGFFKGFAITTLIGITTGILITRPAFSDIIMKIEE